MGIFLSRSSAFKGLSDGSDRKSQEMSLQAFYRQFQDNIEDPEAVDLHGRKHGTVK
jgi:hypothetical protein